MTSPIFTNDFRLCPADARENTPLLPVKYWGTSVVRYVLLKPAISASTARPGTDARENTPLLPVKYWGTSVVRYVLLKPAISASTARPGTRKIALNSALGLRHDIKRTTNVRQQGDARNMAIRLKVNGTTRLVTAEPDTPLLYVLRNDFELNGAKFGCGLAQCGACTVLVDGKATRSCVTPIGTLGQSEITTIEGLGTIEKPHPLQRAFMDEQAAQCGYCINGTEATYRKPYMAHASIGPSCALAEFKDSKMTVWTYSQGVFPLRNHLSLGLKLPIADIRCIHAEGSGCYGHNGADDVGLDAALLARAVAPRPVRLQWMRDDEFGWEPYGPAMIMRAKAALADGKIVEWNYELWSNTHSTRPTEPDGNNLLASWYLAEAQNPAPPRMIPQPAGGGDRNAIPLYDFPRQRIVHHFIKEMPLRVSALRTLGAYSNVFAIESFLDELARAANADPIGFRLCAHERSACEGGDRSSCQEGQLEGERGR